MRITILLHDYSYVCACVCKYNRSQSNKMWLTLYANNKDAEQSEKLHSLSHPFVIDIIHIKDFVL